jgi:type I restriction enzyme M protein
LSRYIENESFQSTFSGLFSEINLGSEKLGKAYAERNAKLCTIITKIAEGLAEFSTGRDALGDAYEYLIGQFAAGSGKKAGRGRTHRHGHRSGFNPPAHVRFGESRMKR